MKLAAIALLLAGFLPAQALRVDTLWSGPRGRTAVAAQARYREPVWWGPPLYTLAPDTGSHRVLLEAEGTRRPLYRLGFTTVLEEWQTVPQSAREERTFLMGLRTPWPPVPARLRVQHRGEKGWQDLLSIPVDPAEALPAPPAPPPAEQAELAAGGPAETTLDLLIVGDGFRAEDRELLLERAGRLAESLLSCEPFRSRREGIAVRVVAPHAAAAGCGPESPLGCLPDTFGMARYVLPTRQETIESIRSAVPADAVIVLANLPGFGGGGLCNLYAVTTAHPQAGPGVIIHEVGHLLAGLGDEYEGGVTYEGMFPAGREPWEPNLTRQTDPARLKWRDLLTPDVPLPTPARDARFAGAVGLFEGGGYTKKGIYRPAAACLMRSLGAGAFCPVCRRALAGALDFWQAR